MKAPTRKTVVRCTRASWCPSMAARRHPANARRSGFAPVEVMNFVTGARRVVGMAFHADRHDRGLMINRCPWCGADLRWWRENKTKAPPPKSKRGRRHA